MLLNADYQIDELLLFGDLICISVCSGVYLPSILL